jgi:DNA-binding MarR family transcriptional regulator
MGDSDLVCAQKVWAVLPQLMRAIAAYWRQQAQPLDLTIGQIRVLKALRYEEQAVGELASKLLVSTPTMTRLIDTLVERGLVERQEDPSDRRVVRLRLTRKGEQVFHGFEQRALRCVEVIMAGLGAEEKKEVARAMDLLQAALQRLPDKERRTTVHG